MLRSIIVRPRGGCQAAFVCIIDLGQVTLFSKVCHNWVKAYGYGDRGICNFSSDDGSAIVTMSDPHDATDNFRMGDITQYCGPPTTTNVTNRQTYPVWIQPDWARWIEKEGDNNMSRYKHRGIVAAILLIGYAAAAVAVYAAEYR